MSDQLSTQDDANFFNDFYAAQEANVAANEQLVSRLALVQNSSPEMTSQTSGYKVGMWIDSLTRAIYSTYGPPEYLTRNGVTDAAPIHYCAIVTIFKLPNEYIRWNTRAERKADSSLPLMAWKTLDANEQRVKEGVWKKYGGTFGETPEQKGVAPPVTVNSNILVLPISLTDGMPLCNPLVLTFSRTSSRVGETFVSQMMQSRVRGELFWNRIYYLRSKADKSDIDDNTYLIYQYTAGDNLEKRFPLERFAQAREAIESVCRPYAQILMDKNVGYAAQARLISSAQLVHEEHGPGSQSDKPSDDQPMF